MSNQVYLYNFDGAVQALKHSGIVVIMSELIIKHEHAHKNKESTEKKLDLQ